MAHTCPECYMICHCGGDIDDIDWGESIHCTHYKNPECDGYEGDDDIWENEDRAFGDSIIDPEMGSH